MYNTYSPYEVNYIQQKYTQLCDEKTFVCDMVKDKDMMHNQRLLIQNNQDFHEIICEKESQIQEQKMAAC